MKTNAARKASLGGKTADKGKGSNKKVEVIVAETARRGVVGRMAGCEGAPLSCVNRI